MKSFAFLFSLSVFLFLFSACSNYSPEDLYGTWHCDEFDFVFKKDKTMSLRRGDVKQNGTFRPFGNTLELVSEENTVITRVSIIAIKNDTMKIDMPVLGSSRNFVLTRVKE